jgi:hypothetical protein
MHCRLAVQDLGQRFKSLDLMMTPAFRLRRLHNISLWYSMELLDEAYDLYWMKYPLLKQLMRAHKDVNWFMVTDSLLRTSFPSPAYLRKIQCSFVSKP